MDCMSRAADESRPLTRWDVVLEVGNMAGFVNPQPCRGTALFCGFLSVCKCFVGITGVLKCCELLTKSVLAPEQGMCQLEDAAFLSADFL